MKYLCLGYLEEEKWDAMPASEREAWIERCSAYDDVLRKGGHFVRGEALQSEIRPIDEEFTARANAGAS